MNTWARTLLLLVGVLTLAACDQDESDSGIVNVAINADGEIVGIPRSGAPMRS